MFNRILFSTLAAAALLTAVPALASDASLDKAASTQDSSSATVTKTDGAQKHDCSCCSHMHHS
jgi:hypothetical protein